MTAAAVTREQVLAWLEEVKDPEVPVISVVELGVVRRVEVDATSQAVTVDITPTYSGCPAMHVMESDIVASLKAHGVVQVNVRTTFSEPWTTDWISREAREKLRAYGIAPPTGTVHEEPGLVTLRRATAVACPFCGSSRTTLKSEFGSTACKAIYACDECRQPFDYFKGH